jgi:hypothetical protein
MEEKEQFAIQFTIWKDNNFSFQKSGNYYPTYNGLSMYDLKPYTLIELIVFYREQLQQVVSD